MKKTKFQNIEKKLRRVALAGLASFGLATGCTYHAGEDTYDTNSLQGRITLDLLNNGDVVNTTDYEGNDGIYSSRNFSFEGHDAMAYVITFLDRPQMFVNGPMRYSHSEKRFINIAPNLSFSLREDNGARHVFNNLMNDSSSLTDLAFREDSSPDRFRIPWGANVDSTAFFQGDTLYNRLLESYSEQFFNDTSN